MIAQQSPEVGRRHALRLARVVEEDDHALATNLVEAAMADEVEDVPRPLPEDLLQVARRAAGHPDEFDQAPPGEIREGRVEPLPLAIDVERGKVGRTDYHPQNAQGRLHEEWRHRLRQRDVPDHRRMFRQGHIVAAAGIEQVLPGECGQLGRLEAKLDAHPGVLASGLAPGGLEPAEDVAAEQSLPELLAERLDGLGFGRLHASPRRSRAQQGDLERLQVVLQGESREGHAHLAGGLARR